MSTTLNKHRLKNLLRAVQISLETFESQGHAQVYFTAQFFRGGRKQNGIERGDPASFSRQLRTYITSEEADSARIEFVSESTGKVIYSKALTDLRKADGELKGLTTQQQLPASPYAGLGEAQIASLVDRRVNERQQQDEFVRLGKEVDELRKKNEELNEANYELESKVKAKSELEFYSGIIGTAFPGLASMLSGTPLAQAANFLAGAPSVEKEAPGQLSGTGGESNAIADQIGEFCSGLDEQELGAMHLLFMAFERDRSMIQSALQFITTGKTARQAA